MLADEVVLTVECPECEAKPGEQCMAWHGSVPMHYATPLDGPHEQRVDAAEAEYEDGAPQEQWEVTTPPEVYLTGDEDEEEDL